VNLNDLKALSPEQYEKCKLAALRRIQARIGDKPQRSQFRREYARVWELMDLPLLLVFLAAFVVSSLHIADHMSASAAASFETLASSAGLRLNQHGFVTAHQIAYVLLAEFAMLSFFTAWQIRSKSIQSWLKWLHPLLIMALTAALFVLLVNISSGVGLLEGIMPPLFTIGIGFRLEAIASEFIARRSEIDHKYSIALASWEQIQADPTQHPDYLPILRAEIWHYLTVKLSSNRAFADAPRIFRWQAVEREIQREHWVEMPPEEAQNDPFGTTAHVLDASENGVTMPNDNGLIATENVTK
jgi:hypothetical protein